MAADIHIRRVYDPPQGADGTRVLVDRLWPRGLSKSKAQVDLWLRDVAPSAELRKWFDHRADRWAEFRKRYRAELKGGAALDEAMALTGRVTLVYAAKDEAHNNAVALAEILRDHRR